MRVGLRAGDLQAQLASAVGQAHELDAGVQLAPGQLGVVDAADAQAQLEAQVLVVAQGAGDVEQVLAGDEQGELVVLDDDLLDGGGRVDAGLLEVLDEGVDDVVEPAAVGARGGGGEGDDAAVLAVAGGVTGVGGAELAGGGGDDLQAQLGAHGGAGDLGDGGDLGGLGQGLGARVVSRGVLLTHASRPFISWVGVADSAAASTARAISSRCLNSGFFSIWRVSSSMALRSISGRGGQPGR